MPVVHYVGSSDFREITTANFVAGSVNDQTTVIFSVNNTWQANVSSAANIFLLTFPDFSTSAAIRPIGAPGFDYVDATELAVAVSAEGAARAGADTAHVVAVDPHVGYRLESVPITAADVAADVATQAELDAQSATYVPLAGPATIAGLKDFLTAPTVNGSPIGGDLTPARQRDGTTVGESSLVLGSLVFDVTTDWGIDPITGVYYDPGLVVAGEEALLSVEYGGAVWTLVSDVGLGRAIPQADVVGLAAALSAKLATTGGTMLGPLNMGTNLITDVVDPVAAQDAATRAFVLASIAGLGATASSFEGMAVGKAFSEVNFAIFSQSSAYYTGGRRASSGAQNAEVVFLLPVTLTQGTWTFVFLYSTGTTSGIFTVAGSPDGTSFTDLTTFDAYSAAGATTRTEAAALTIPAGTKYLRFKMATKNASSSSYVGALQGFTGTRTGA